MKRNKTPVSMLVLLLFAVATFMAQTAKMVGKGAAKREAAVSRSVTPPIGADYVIGPDDVLNVSVWKEPELSRAVLVRPDGKITLPLVNDLQASGSTPAQLQARIEKGLSEYLSKPVVTVIVQEAKSHKFNILGEVEKPGTYPLNSPTTVLDAISLAGGFREWAKVNDVYILRETSPGHRERIRFDYKKVIKGAAPDTQLKVKDTIVVP